MNSEQCAGKREKKFIGFVKKTMGEQTEFSITSSFLLVILFFALVLVLTFVYLTSLANSLAPLESQGSKREKRGESRDSGQRLCELSAFV